MYQGDHLGQKCPKNNVPRASARWLMLLLRRNYLIGLLPSPLPTLRENIHQFQVLCPQKVVAALKQSRVCE